MTTAPATVGVVGLGNMGLPMAAHLLAAGFGVRGYDVRPEAADALDRAGGVPTASPAETAAGAQVVITSLPSVTALQEVVGGAQGLASATPDGLIVIETSTLPVTAKADAARALGRAGAVLLDCPLSGTASQMLARDIAVYASGDPAGCPLPLFSAAAQLHLAAMAQGRLDEDPACVFAVLEGMSIPP